MKPLKLDYRAVPTLDRFRASDAFVRCCIGPFGSGKSTACVRELLLRSLAQEPGPDEVRRTRWLVVRNTYRELQDTTRKTFEQEIRRIEEAAGVRFCTWRESDMMAVFDLRGVYAEVLFRALDTPEDANKVLSLEITGAWINEAREIGKPVFDLILARIPRFPAIADGGASWFGAWLDTNPPDTDHWIYRLFEEDRPAGWELFRQPGGRSPKAENRPNLHPQYYDLISQGKEADWVKVYVDGEYGFVKEGKPIYPEYNDVLHCKPVEPLGGEILLGMDFGLTPALVFVQRDPKDGQFQVFREFVTDDMGAVRIAREAARTLKAEYPNRPVRGWGDPAGAQRSPVDERTPFDVVQGAGLPMSPAPTNDFVLRREAVAGLLTRLTIAGRPALVLDPRCRVLRKAMGGGYCFQRLRVSGEERYRDQPLKNMYSHVAEALQYLAVGEGEDRRAVRIAGPPRRRPPGAIRAFGSSR